MTLSWSVDKIRRLMPTDQPQSIYPLRLARNREVINGTVRLDSMQRVERLLSGRTGTLDYSLSFEIDAAGLCIVNSTIRSRVTMECQRCLRPFAISICKNTVLGVVRSKEEAEGLAVQYEPLYIENEILCVGDLLEDELLLALPIAPLHSAGLCPGQTVLERVNENAKYKPFACLAALKGKT